ncbi:tRNA pseudouridine(38-40) synthase TruA [Pseudalkalibacillus hwajinpoensis]|uniref:tRNA pseudouridine(38-40) synthase TruA n=1 Tax=Guptibacillus hwajinpoensis TaxID=208199 RepID=UPI001CFDAAA5|nr:tRNA pseudouridine(38-40) synthase TruA [Pseudalkalibacillus hwajinpoensis]
MQRIKMTLSYDGTAYNGYQVQPNGRTVQEEVQRALKQMHKGETIIVTGSGRTDARVHACGQVIHFDTTLSIPLENWTRALNAQLPDDVRVLHTEAVSSDFHARYDVVRKTYQYRVHNRAAVDVFRRNYAVHEPHTLNVLEMKRAAADLIGEHDFTSFCASKTDVKNKVRTIYRIEIEQMQDELVFTFEGSGFLYNMVRILMGTLLEVGKGRRSANEMSSILNAKDRNKAGKTAPPHGLYLWEVSYS